MSDQIIGTMSHAVPLRIVLIAAVCVWAVEGCKTKCDACGYSCVTPCIGTGVCHDHGFNKHRSLGLGLGGDCLGKHHGLGLGCKHSGLGLGLGGGCHGKHGLGCNKHRSLGLGLGGDCLGKHHGLGLGCKHPGLGLGLGGGCLGKHHGLGLGYKHSGLGLGLGGGCLGKHGLGCHRHRSLGLGLAGDCLAKKQCLGCNKKLPCLALKHKCDLLKHKCDLLKHKCCTKNHQFHKFNKGCLYYDDGSDSKKSHLGHGHSHPLLQPLHDALDRRYSRWNKLCDRLGKSIPITI